MPQSRNRKKKAKKKRPPVDRDKANLGWAKIVRKGRHVFVKNTMTAAEHDAYQTRLRENRPQVYAEIKDMITEAVDLINSYDKLIVLSALAGFYYETTLTDPDDDGKAYLALEYLQSIALASSNIHAGVMPDQAVLSKIAALLQKIRDYFRDYIAVEHVTNRYTDLQGQLRLNMIAETLFIRGEGYWQHIQQLFSDMFTPHDPIFLKHYGCTARDIVDTFNSLEAAFECRVILSDGTVHPNRQVKLAHWVQADLGRVNQENFESGEFWNDFARDCPDMTLVDGKIIQYPLNQIDTAPALFKIYQITEIQAKVVKALSLKFGQNGDFALPEKIKYEILNPSGIYSNPIVEDDLGNFYFFHMNLPSRNLFLIGQRLIERADADYYQRSFLGNRIQISKDEFIEGKTLSLFRKMLPQVQFYKGVHYKYSEPGLTMRCFKEGEGDFELDILGIGPNATYLIEVKAGLVSPEARRGAISSIQDDLSNIIGDAICQSYRAYRYIVNDPMANFETADGRQVAPLNRHRIFRISISFSYVGTLIAALSKLQQAGIFDQAAEYAWTVNIFDLMAFADLVPSEDFFVDYLTKRFEMYKDDRLANIDEMDMLGLYYANDMKLDKEMKHMDFVQLNGYSTPIQEYFDGRGPKPTKVK